MNGDSWLRQASVLEAAEDWESALSLATEAWQLQVPMVELVVLGAEAALKLGRPVLAFRWLARADQAKTPALAWRVANLKGEALMAVPSLDRAERFFGEAFQGALEQGDRALAARAARNLASVAAARGEETCAKYWGRKAGGVSKKSGERVPSRFGREPEATNPKVIAAELRSLLSRRPDSPARS